MTDQNTVHVLSLNVNADRWPSIFEDGDNVYDTYANPAEDPRRAHTYANTAARTPRALKRAA